MVTILDPVETIPVELTPVAEAPQPRWEQGFMAYTMPFPGVKYYAFEPRRRVVYPHPDVATIRQTLTVKLIDERVILI